MELSSFRQSSSSSSSIIGFLHQRLSNLVIITVFLLLLPTELSGANAPGNITIPAIIVLGDSIVDQGNNNYLKTLAKCNFPPYGDDFVGGKPTGRCSNGKTLADILAEEFGVKEFVPAYLDPNLQDKDLLTGVSFASGATGLDLETSNLISVLSMPKQLELLKEYIGKLKGIVGEEGTKEILENSLFVVVVGSNDLTNTYFTLGLRRLQYNIESYTDLLVRSASEFLEGLYKLGARRVAIHGVLPIGCMPSQRTLKGGILRKCEEKYNVAAQLLNKKMSNAVSSFQNRQSDSKSRVFFVDLYSPLLELIQNYTKYGFEEADKGCCGTGKVEVSIFCNKLSKTCRDHSTYLFWDSFHPTERGYRVLVGKIFQTYIDNLQRPPNTCKCTTEHNHSRAFCIWNSLVDQGNNNHIKTICRCNFPPYGEDFPGGIPTGRFSNGKTPADILAEKFGIKEYLPAYLDPNLQDKDLLTGVSFASGATGLDPQTPKDMFVLSLPDQLKMFKEYIGKLKGIVGEEGTKEILDNGLFAVVVGSNDLAVTYAGTSLRRFQYNISSYTDLLVQSASEFLEGLYELGARRIAVHSIPPIGCVPAQRTLSGGKLRKCADKYNEAAEMMNQKLSNEVSSFQNRQSDRKSRVFFLDLYSPFLEIIQNHKKYGFEVADEGSCGKGKLAVGVFCNRLTKTCPNHSAYLFWDSFHPTERGNRVIIGNIFQTYIDNLH